MKFINFLLFLFISFNFYLFNVNSQLVLFNYTTGIITPFYPGDDLVVIVLNFKENDLSLSQNLNIQFYDQNNFNVLSLSGYLSLDGGTQVPGTSSSSSTVAAIVLNDNIYKRSNKNNNYLKAYQASYTVILNPFSPSLLMGAGEFPEYLTFTINYENGASLPYSDKIYFNAPAYNKTAMEEIFSLKEGSQIPNYGDGYCKFAFSLEGLSDQLQSSYGVYYVNGTRMLPIKPKANSNVRYYGFLQFPSGTSGFQNIYVVDGLTNQKILNSVSVSCTTPTVTSIPQETIKLDQWGFAYYIFTTPFKVNLVYLNGASLRPTSIRLDKNSWVSFIRFTSPQGSSSTMTIENINYSITSEAAYSFPASPTAQIKISKISSTLIVSGDTMVNYKNSQNLFYVNMVAPANDYGKVLSIDYVYGGIVFFSDKEVVGNIYKKIVYLPDEMVDPAYTLISVYLNTDIGGRTLLFSYTLSLPQYVVGYPTVFSKQENDLKTSTTSFINSFYSSYTFNLIQMGDITQTPNYRASYYSTNMTSSYAKFDEKVYIKSNYPFGYTGYFNQLNYTPSVPLLSDTPSSTIKSDPAYKYSTKIVNKPFTRRDFVSPFIFSNFTFSNDSSKQLDQVMITIVDSIGISSIKPMCNVSLGPTTFTLLPSNMYSSSSLNNANSTYQFNFKMNRYFCTHLPIVNCTDIRGNNFYYSGEVDSINAELYSGFDSCLVNSSSIPNSKLLALSYRYNDVSNLTFNVLISGNIDASTSVQLLVYDNYDNIGEPIILLKLSLGIISSTIKSQRFFGTISIDNLQDTTSKKYISIIVSSSSSGTSYTLSTKELEFLNRISQSITVTSSIISSEFIIRNKNYYNSTMLVDLFNDSTIGLILESDKFTMYNIKTTYISLIKNVTFAIKTQTLPYNLYYYFNSSDPNTYFSKNSTAIVINLLKPIQRSSKLFVESICDYFENCYNIGPYLDNSAAVYLEKTSIVKRTTFATINDPTFSRNYIDISSSNRKVKVSIDINFNQLPFNQTIISEKESYPLFYVTEKESNDQVSCQLKQISPNSPTYQCDLTIPLMYGSRGLGHCSIYNIIYDDGYLDGKIFDICKLFLYTQYLLEPVLWEVSTKMYDTNLYFYGLNLNLLDSMMLDKSLFIGDFIFLNTTSGYYKLKDPLTKPVDLLIGSKTYSVFIYTCLKDDCSGNGKCNMTSLTCQCNQGWTGTDCSIDNTFTCLNGCNGHGNCSIDKVCNCDLGYSGVSCEFSNSNISINVNTSSTQPSVVLGGFNSSSLNNFTKSSQYSIDLVYIQEVDIYGQVVNKFNFSNIGWSLLSTNNDGTSNTFNTTLLQYSNFTVKIDFFKQAEELTWANEKLTIAENSIKYSVRIENYTFSSNLNKMEMYYEATPNSDLHCAIKQQSQWGANNLNDMHWVTLPNNQVQLYGRFSNNLIIDDRIISTSNEGIDLGSKIQIKVNIPFFKEYVELDPDWSVLVDVDMDSKIYDECGNEIGTKENKKKWVIPVAVVVGVVGATVIFVAIFTLLYRKNTNLRLKVLSFTLKFKRNHSGVSMKNFNN